MSLTVNGLIDDADLDDIVNIFNNINVKFAISLPVQSAINSVATNATAQDVVPANIAALLLQAWNDSESIRDQTIKPEYSTSASSYTNFLIQAGLLNNMYNTANTQYSVEVICTSDCTTYCSSDCSTYGWPDYNCTQFEGMRDQCNHFHCTMFNDLKPDDCTNYGQCNAVSCDTVASNCGDFFGCDFNISPCL